MARKTSRSPALRESGAQAFVLGLDPVGRLHPRSHEGGQAGLRARSSSDGLVTFGLTGYSGGKLKKMQQNGLHVELDDMGMVESIHLCVFHWVLNDVYARINREGRYA